MIIVHPYKLYYTLYVTVFINTTITKKKVNNNIERKFNTGINDKKIKNVSALIFY